MKNKWLWIPLLVAVIRLAVLISRNSDRPVGASPKDE